MRKLSTFLLLTASVALSSQLLGACVQQDYQYGHGYQTSYYNRQAQPGYGYEANYGYQTQPGYGYEANYGYQAQPGYGYDVNYGYQAQPGYGYEANYGYKTQPGYGYRHGYHQSQPAYGYGSHQIYQDQNFAQPRGYGAESGFRQQQIQQDAKTNPAYEGTFDNQNFNPDRSNVNPQNPNAPHYGTNAGTTQETTKTPTHPTTNQGAENTNVNPATDATTRNR